MSEIFFSLDPGSQKTGWAVMRPGEQLIRAGLLLPDKKTAPNETRIGDMCHSLWTLLNYWCPGLIIIEWTSGKVSKRHGCGGGAGLAVHGASCGALWRECIAWLRYQPPKNQIETKIVLIKENDWSRGVNKKDRQIAIADLFPAYRIEQDMGGDIGDAIGLNIFYQRERAVRLAKCLK